MSYRCCMPNYQHLPTENFGLVAVVDREHRGGWFAYCSLLCYAMVGSFRLFWVHQQDLISKESLHGYYGSFSQCRTERTKAKFEKR